MVVVVLGEAMVSAGAEGAAWGLLWLVVVVGRLEGMSLDRVRLRLRRVIV